jgi:1,4-dihydroxy-2-naphthoate octaprenyltransferase
MDIVIHWGVLRYLRKEIKANAAILIVAILLDVIVLGALLWVKAQSDMLVIWASLLGLVLIFGGGMHFYQSKPIQG